MSPSNVGTEGCWQTRPHSFMRSPVVPPRKEQGYSRGRMSVPNRPQPRCVSSASSLQGCTIPTQALTPSLAHSCCEHTHAHRWRDHGAAPLLPALPGAPVPHFFI